MAQSDSDAEGARSLIVLTIARQEHHVFGLAGHDAELVTFSRRYPVMFLPVILEVIQDGHSMVWNVLLFSRCLIGKAIVEVGDQASISIE